MLMKFFGHFLLLLLLGAGGGYHPIYSEDPKPVVPKHVALLIMATGRYVAFAEKLIDSAEQFFCTECKKTYVIFTDAKPGVTKIAKGNNTIIYVPQKRLGWPHDTLMRSEVYLRNFTHYADTDYIFASDADMLFVAPVGNEILLDRVCVRHPGFAEGIRGSYETRAISTAAVKAHEGTFYCAGGFYGAATLQFKRLTEDMVNRINRDLAKNFIAVWHDESHLNRWFIDNPPTKLLDPGYCYPEYTSTMDATIWNNLKQYTPRLMALNKNHQQMRK